MPKKFIKITFNDDTHKIYDQDTLEFAGLLKLFERLIHEGELCTKHQKLMHDEVLPIIHQHQIKEIEFSEYCKYEFTKVKDGYEVKYSSHEPDMSEILEMISDDKTRVQVIGGTLEDLKAMGDDLPEEIREIIAYVSKVQAERRAENQRDERQTHDGPNTKH